MTKTQTEPKAPKAAKAPKEPKEAKAQDKTEEATVKRKRRDPDFKTCVLAVLKKIRPGVRISDKAKDVIDLLVKDMGLQLCDKAAKLVEHKHSKTLGFKDIQSAVRMGWPESLAATAVQRSDEAIAKLEESKAAK